MEETVRREVAEEVGIDLEQVNMYNYSQPWPLPDGSLMIPHVSVAEMNQQVCEKCNYSKKTLRFFELPVKMQNTT